MTPTELGRRWRHGGEPVLVRRRAIIGLSLTAMGSLSVVALYQSGIIAHLPDPPLPGFNADKVHGSAEAYALLTTPDAFLGLSSYAVTATLAAMGGRGGGAVRSWLPLALAAKAAFDVAQAGRLTWHELTQQGALSAWSLVVSATTAMTATLALPEARFAVRRLLRTL